MEDTIECDCGRVFCIKDGNDCPNGDCPYIANQKE